MILACVNCTVDNNRVPVGHYVEFFSHFQRLFKNVFEITIACPEEYVSNIESSSYLLTGNAINEESRRRYSNRILEGFRKFKIIRRIIMQDAKKIIFQSGSFGVHCAAIATLRKTQCKGKEIFIVVYSDLINGKGIKNQINKFLFRAVKSKISGIITGNEEVGRVYGLPYLVLPDHFNIPLDTETKEAHHYDMGLFGLLTEDKNIESVVEAFGSTRFRLLIAGRFKHSNYKFQIQSQVSEHSNIDLIPRYLGTQEYRDLMKMCKFIILPYSTEYVRSSGVFYDALFLLKPVIVSEAPFFNIVAEKSLGFSYSSSPVEIVDRIISCDYVELRQNIARYLLEIQESSFEQAAKFFGVKIDELNDVATGPLRQFLS